MTFFELKSRKERDGQNYDENMSSTKKGAQPTLISSHAPYVSQALLGLIAANAATTVKTGSRYWT